MEVKICNFLIEMDCHEESLRFVTSVSLQCIPKLLEGYG